MIAGTVEAEGLPIIHLQVAGRTWRATIDTGFNGDLELPPAVEKAVNARFFAEGRADLAGGQGVQEDYYLVDFPFDGRTVRAVASFVPGSEILIGTRLLRDYHLEIDFPVREVKLERVR